MRRRPVLLVAGLLLVLLPLAAAAQRPGFFGRSAQYENVPYDGRFTFVRVNYRTAPGGFWYRGQPAWSHGYPTSERNLMSIMSEPAL